MEKYNALSSVFYLRSFGDMKKCYLRADFWASIVIVLLVVASFLVDRYTKVNFVQLWHHTGPNWAFAFASIASIVFVAYIFVVNFLFRNNAILSAINIGVGLLMLALLVVECMVLKNGIKVDGAMWKMSNDPAIGFYLAIVSGVLIVGLEFYKLGVQGYYSREEVAQEKGGYGVEIVDGVVMVDGEQIQTNDNENDTRIRVLTEEEETEISEQSSDEMDKKE